MAYTSPELVRRHLNTVQTGRFPVMNVQVTLNGTQSVLLPHRPLTVGSVVVKARRSHPITHTRVTLEDNWVSLPHGNLIGDTVIVARDASLSQLYAANVDVVIDSMTGRVRRIPGGGIANGQDVSVMYDFYHLYTLDDDFTADAAAGTIARRSAGSIADGQTVLVDYEVDVDAVPDDVISQAIDEASDAVLSLIDPRFHSQLLPGLVIGETHLAVAAVCRIQAMRLLSEHPASHSPIRDQAGLWVELAASYETSGRDRLKRYTPPIPTLQSARKG
ncbi:MAG: hypothetical protein Kow0074_23670 [Candidatus Zixiibacteriota bacterium]